MNRDIDVATITDPIALTVGARHALESLYVFLMHADDRAGFAAALRDRERMRMVLDHIAFVGEYLARLTVVVTSLDDLELAELQDEVRLDLMAAAAELVFARARVAQGRTAETT